MMKIFTVLSLLVLMIAPAKAQGVFDWNHSWQSLKDWPEGHWESQNYEPLIVRQEHRLPAAMRRSRSELRVTSGEVAPVMARLKHAKIVMGAHELKESSFWFWMPDRVADNAYVIDIGQNFYTLPAHEKNAIMQMMGQVHNFPLLMIRDINTKNYVGQFAEQKLSFF